MTVDELLHELDRRHVEIWLDGELMRFRAQDGQLDKELLSELRRHKAAVIESLSEGDGSATQDRFQPMSVGQEALYFLHTLAPLSPAYNVASAARIVSHVDVHAMRQVFRQLVSRHDMLRATCELNNGEPRCRIRAGDTLDFQQVLLAETDEQRLADAVRREYRRPFDLATGPLFRARLFTVGECDHVLLLTLHHIVFDFWSLWVLHDEFRQLYGQYTGGETALLPTLEKTYADFVTGQQALLDSDRGRQQWDYWSQRLAGDLAEIELPVERNRPERASLLGATHHFRMSDRLSRNLRKLAASHGATPFMLLLAIFKTLLHRYSGQEDLIVGTAAAGRSPEFTQVAGYFVNTLAIRTDAAGTPRFSEYLSQVKTRTLEAIENQEFPFPKLVDRLNPRRDQSGRPICNVMFGVQKPQQFNEVQQLLQAENRTLDWGGLQVRNYEFDQQEGQFELTLEIFDTGESFLGALKYDVDLFAADTVRRFAEHYVRLAEAIADDPDRPLSDYEVLGETERQRILGFAATGSIEPPADPRAHRFFERVAEQTPNRIAAFDSEQSLTYRQLNRRANQLARLLIDGGVTPGTKVPCYLERGLDAAVALLAVLKAGGTYVPLDSANPPARLSEIVRQCGGNTVVLQSKATSPGEPRLDTSSRSPLGTLVLDEHRERLCELEHNDLDLEFSPETLAYVLFTSGSTGAPKGVCVTHRALAEHVISIREAFGLRESDRMLQFSNLGFDPSLEQMLAPLSLGAAVMIRGERLWTPAEFWQTVAKYELTVANLPPAYVRECSEEFARNRAETAPLRLMIVGGDKFPAETLDVWRDCGFRLLNAYGPTEAVITATVFDVADHKSLARRLPIGRPKPGMRAYVLDSRGRLAPIGIAGELHLAGRMLADGYLGDPNLTAARFLADPFSNDPASRMYRTGDRAQWSVDGNLEFVGRSDRQIKINGFRVETGEIECILGNSSAVRQCHVQVSGDKGCEVNLVAWVVPTEGANPTQDDLCSYLNARLPSYMVPRQFVFLPEMPIGVSGKIDTKALPKPAATRPLECEFVPPRNEIERVLADIWSDNLGIASIGVNDCFFDLGGGSLTSLRIASRATEAGLLADGQPVEPGLLFRYPSIGELAAQLQKRAAE